VTGSLFQAYFYSAIDDNKSMLIDGYPRTIPQLDDIFRLAELEKREVLGIQFVIPDDIAFERMASRGREDDTEEAMKHRIAQFYKHTMPVIDYFGQHATLVKIDATRGIEEIAEEVYTYIQ
jgi:adenylate kinase